MFLEIAQGAGLAGATGVRPFLPPLLAGALARADAGLDFDGTDYAFLESPGFLAVVLALAVASYAAARLSSGPAGSTGDRGLREPVAAATLTLALALGALLFAGSLAEGGEESWPGLIGGAACAALGFVAVSGLLARVRRRLDEQSAALLPVWADAAALALAAVAIVLPPAALVGLGALLLLLLSGRRAEDRKYQGLRILR